MGGKNVILCSKWSIYFTDYFEHKKFFFSAHAEFFSYADNVKILKNIPKKFCVGGKNMILCLKWSIYFTDNFEHKKYFFPPTQNQGWKNTHFFMFLFCCCSKGEIFFSFSFCSCSRYRTKFLFLFCSCSREPKKRLFSFCSRSCSFFVRECSRIKGDEIKLVQRG